MRTNVTKENLLLSLDDKLLRSIGQWLDLQGRIGNENWKRWGKPRLAAFVASKLGEAAVQRLYRADPSKGLDSQLTAALGPVPKDVILTAALRPQLVDMLKRLAGRTRVDVSPSAMKKAEIISYLKRKCSREEISELAGLGKKATAAPARKASKAARSAAKAPAKSRVAAKYEFDVGLSFSGEQRPIAERLATALRKAGVRVFIDSAFLDQIWGHSLHQVLDEAYQKCRFFIPILSASYKTRAYPTHELQVALSESVERERAGYLLPLRVDGTAIPGLPRNIAYLDLRSTSVERVVELVKKKMQA